MNAPYNLTERRAAKLTVDDFLLLDGAGAFAAYAKTELINGAIIVVNAQYALHMRVKVRLLLRLADVCKTLSGGLEAWSEGSIDMAPHSMPEPDLFITNATPTNGPIRLDSLVLVGEVADSTVKDDLGEKAELYALRGIPEYWVVDLPGNLIHQMWSPSAAGYAERREYRLGDRMDAATVARLGVETAGLV